MDFELQIIKWWKQQKTNLESLLDDQDELDKLTEEEVNAIRVIVRLADKRIERYSRR